MSKTNVKHGDIISRRKNFELKDGRRYWLTTNSGPSYDQGKWSNCLYLHFTKEDFPEITFPKLIPCDWGKQKQRFDYNSWSLADLPWHGGITYYEEMYHGEAQRTFVKAGCDFQHLWDDHFMLDDNGEMILDNDGEELRLAFEEFLSKLNQPTTPGENG